MYFPSQFISKTHMIACSAICNVFSVPGSLLLREPYREASRSEVSNAASASFYTGLVAMLTSASL